MIKNSTKYKVFDSIMWYGIGAPLTIAFLTGMLLSATTFSIAMVLSYMGTNTLTNLAITTIANLVIVYYALPIIFIHVYTL